MPAAVALPSSKHAQSVKEFVFADAIHLPSSFADLESFREWCRSDSYPERGDVFWLDGVIWVDAHMDEIDFHNAVKTEFVGVIAPIVKRERLGFVYSDRARLIHEQAGLSVEPEVLFVSRESLRTGRIRRIAAAGRGIRELEGSADMVLEVVSDSSEHKDKVVLREKYWRAGVTEYWLVDARGDAPRFDILRRGPRGFITARKVDGWLNSAVFNRRFQLQMGLDEDGIPEFTLSVS
jgi:Uma2 family endonuclease